MRAYTSIRSRRFAALLATSLLLVAAGPAAAVDWLPETDFEWEGSSAQRAAATGIDVLMVRPLAAARVIVGSLIFIPTAAMASPMGREGISAAYEVLIELPVEYAFEREIGEF